MYIPASSNVFNLAFSSAIAVVSSVEGLVTASTVENIATAVAKAKVPVLIFSLEMSKEQMVNRILCSEAQVDSTKVRTGKLDTDDWVKLGKASGDFDERSLRSASQM